MCGGCEHSLNGNTPIKGDRVEGGRDTFEWVGLLDVFKTQKDPWGGEGFGGKAVKKPVGDKGRAV